jgi:hypothetical protein
MERGVTMLGTIVPEYAAVRHVLSAPLIASRTAPYVGEDGFDFDGLERQLETMSGGGALLVGIARDLWTAEHTVKITDIVRRLDTANFARVVEALRIARGGFTWDLVDLAVAGRLGEELAA